MKNGFTLVELLAVIVILGILTIFVAPNMIKTSNKTKKNLYEAKVKKIEGAGKEYGSDNLDNLKILYNTTPDSTTPYYTISSLIKEGYLSSENKKYLTSGQEQDKVFTNPTNNLNMKDCKVYVWYYKNKTSSQGSKVMAKLDKTGNCVCRGC